MPRLYETVYRDIKVYMHLLELPSAVLSIGDLVSYSMKNFMPETILTVGFLLAIVLDLLIRDRSYKKITGYFALVVLGYVFYASLVQMTWYPDKAGVNWIGGNAIFPYSETLPKPVPSEIPGVLAAPYAMVSVDNFAVIFKLIISLAGMLVIGMSLVSREVKERGRRNGEFFSLLLAMTLGMFLMTESMDLIMMYISLELVSITSYIMAGFMKDDSRSTEASMKYVLFGAFSSGLMIYGFSILYGLTGTTNVNAICAILERQIVLGGGANMVALWSAVILALAGMGYKISAAPFHFWTPDVYEGAPIPVTALLSVASKAAGFGLLMRFLIFAIPSNGQTMQPYLNWPIVIAVLSAFTMTLGNFAALRQSNVKRLLPYSTIAHAGYMMAGLVTIAAG
ncbi:MAG TPA: NADH-quinone oxidoreductase subunit N, partial [Steroidobacteraceae bacterium]|nr:NADH-quinone oxidoreductase subunit N [Steroidobacteraceae bacterium]